MRRKPGAPVIADADLRLPDSLHKMQLTPSAQRRAAGLLAIVTSASLVFQLVLALDYSFGLGRTLAAALGVFFGYFTVLTNLLVAATCACAAWAPASAPGRQLGRAPAAAGIAASITLVGLGQYFLLSDTAAIDGPQRLADVLLHYVTPPAYVLWWWLGARTAPLRWSHALAWCAYPVGYFVVTLLRGELTGLYPYPFVDLAALGIEHTMANALALLGVFAAIGLVLVALDRATRRFTSA